jgi:hypothetical protein
MAHNRVMSIQTADPKQFFNEQRLDLVCKYAIFRDLQTNSNDPLVWNLYRNHILKRNGGVEPKHKHNTRDMPKTTIDDFVRCAQELYVSMSKRGFDPEYPVPHTNTGILLNGAHRVSCAAVLGIPVVTACIKDNRHKGTPWDKQWFQDNSFTYDQMDFITKLLDQITTEESP